MPVKLFNESEELEVNECDKNKQAIWKKKETKVVSIATPHFICASYPALHRNIQQGINIVIYLWIMALQKK